MPNDVVEHRFEGVRKAPRSPVAPLVATRTVERTSDFTKGQLDTFDEVQLLTTYKSASGANIMRRCMQFELLESKFLLGDIATGNIGGPPITASDIGLITGTGQDPGDDYPGFTTVPPPPTVALPFPVLRDTDQLTT
jgi:hypothetical protein